MCEGGVPCSIGQERAAAMGGCRALRYYIVCYLSACFLCMQLCPGAQLQSDEGAGDAGGHHRAGTVGARWLHTGT